MSVACPGARGLGEAQRGVEVEAEADGRCGRSECVRKDVQLVDRVDHEGDALSYVRLRAKPAERGPVRRRVADDDVVAPLREHERFGEGEG